MANCRIEKQDTKVRYLNYREIPVGATFRNKHNLKYYWKLDGATLIVDTDTPNYLPDVTTDKEFGDLRCFFLEDFVVKINSE